MPANASIVPPSDTQPLLVEELYQRYGKGLPIANWVWCSLRSQRRKVGCLVVVRGARVLKRTLDIVGSLSLLIILLPLFGVVAALIKSTDGGAVLYWQRRVGRWGREFPFPKFRSMVINADRQLSALLSQNDHRDGVTFKMRKDPRITRIGRIIRRLSIDELPQLWCVLRGDMSLVGPRPPIPREVARYTLADRRRLDVAPGLTCIWQVSGRGTIPFSQQVELDRHYIENQSLWLDIRLLLHTVPAVLSGKGAF
jgi:lipopolysaccharide/colanic/teichoic acid biosynthesis glycosyltransferase